MEINDVIGVLVEQNKLFMQQNKSYQDMLFFAITSIIGILIIFLTANFFTMRKFREEEKEKIKLSVFTQLEKENIPLLSQELNSKLDLLVTNKFELLEEKINTLTTELTNFKDKLSQIEQKYDTQLSEIKQKHDSDLSDIKKGFNDKFREMENTYKTKFSNMEERLNKQFDRVNGELKLSEATSWFDKKVFNNAFTYYLAAGNYFIDSNSLGKINLVLSGLEKSASQINYKQTSYLADLTTFSERLDSEYQIQCQKIIDILIKVENL